MAEIKFSSDGIWAVILKLFTSPSFLTALLPFVMSIVSKWFPGLSPDLIESLITVAVQILPLLFAGEMGTRYVMGRLERNAQFKAGWAPDAAGVMQAPSTFSRDPRATA